ncbi:hypothetical protein PV10_03978 [Exophiala mesophila]|uniref:Phosphoglycerate mutase family protein n=1 Tax=Exophiala mesophila TaxID=212818 RepID=A0A0D1XWU6_EXOME|nr:uncharacterized protein PV10_03978 [Exophiala mesophila]KIV92706.1 hypothetical protein PV10_03978 [Exophiala mesophila]
MPVKEILLLRHGHRLAWQLDPTTGKYTSSHRFPSGLPADPPLASHGVQQAVETGEHFADTLGDLVRQDRVRIYSSLFYRCLETLRPSMERLREIQQQHRTQGGLRDGVEDLKVRGELGIGEWFGRAWFKQPRPASPERLKNTWFPWVDDQYTSLVVPDEHGERIEALHDRVARALEAVVNDVDEEYARQGRADEQVTLLLCGHAAQIIASGRALTGVVPEDLDEDDFQCFTCGISRFVRRATTTTAGEDGTGDWRGGVGVAGGWDCVANSDCGHLQNGEERGWHFHGDESFDSYGPPKGEDIKVEDTGEVLVGKL